MQNIQIIENIFQYFYLTNEKFNALLNYLMKEA
jgi:hypothetical protein